MGLVFGMNATNEVADGTANTTVEATPQSYVPHF